MRVATVLVALAIVAGAALGSETHAPPSPLPLCVDAGYQHHATVVVSHLDRGINSPLRVCVGFDEDHLSGHQLLDRSRVKWGSSGSYGGDGTAVCQVDNEPASYSTDCLRADQPYWSIWHATYGGPWTYTRFGLDAVTIRDGDAEGFRYARPDAQAGPDQVGGQCPPPAPPPSPPPPPTPGGGGSGTNGHQPARTGPAAGAPTPLPAGTAPGGAVVAAPDLSPSPVESPPGGRTPSPDRGSRAPTSRQTDVLGPALAAGGGLGLLLLLAVQLLQLRWRR